MMSTITNERTEITAAELLADEVGRFLSFWKLQPTVRGRKVLLYIYKADSGLYTLMCGKPVVSVGSAESLEDICWLYNEFVKKASIHDLVVTIGETNAMHRILEVK